MTRHGATMEGGGWILLVVSLIALLYLLFHPQGQAAITTRINPSKYPLVTKDMADQIVSGQLAARLYAPGTGCDAGAGEQIFDAGNGTLWCVTVNVPSIYSAPTTLVN